mmetsp:Transcript_37708/g.58662  ORF Transcript_37708/g.58662 Transcript_37708/m.58662 type:complete len:114 (+) Transcript_37708:1232-1573(+)
MQTIIYGIVMRIRTRVSSVCANFQTWRIVERLLQFRHSQRPIQREEYKQQQQQQRASCLSLLISPKIVATSLHRTLKTPLKLQAMLQHMKLPRLTWTSKFSSMLGWFVFCALG